MHNFSIRNIAEIGRTITGKTPSSSDPEDFGVETPFVTPSDSFDCSYIGKTERSLSAEGVRKLKGKLLPPDSVLITCIGSAMGKAAMNRGPCITNQQINSIAVSDKNSPQYIYYALKNSYKQLRNAAKGSTALPLLSKGDFDLLPIRIHTEKLVQQQIAKVLSNLDAKIDLNNRINAELEALAKTIYDYWFVQFDFPDANGRPYKSSGGAMIWNDTLKREIPEGWETGHLGKWLSFQRGISYRSSEISADGAPLINLNSFRLDGAIKLDGTKKFSGKFRDDQRVKPGDLVIAITDVTRNADITGRAFVVPDLFGDNPLISCDVAAVQAAPHLSAHYLEKLFNSDHYHKYLRPFASGTLVLHLNLDGVRWFETYLPPRALIDKYDKIALGIRTQVNVRLIQNRELTQLRDWLLPLLMNGQVRVK